MAHSGIQTPLNALGGPIEAALRTDRALHVGKRFPASRLVADAVCFARTGHGRPDGLHRR